MQVTTTKYKILLFTLVFILASILAFLIRYTYPYPCTKYGRHCNKWRTEDNGMSGKFHREWEVCDEEEYYEYQGTCFEVRLK